MTTYIAKKSELKPLWFIVDAKDKVLGRLAPIIANRLRGKDKPNFALHMDTGDYVIVINADKVMLTGGKMDKKIYYTHTGYRGGIKKETARTLNTRKPTKLVELAVFGMLPKNKLRKIFMRKLKIYAGEVHPHSAQSPQPLIK